MSYPKPFAHRLNSKLSTPLRPARGLLSPLWLGALATLILNDHVLKQNGALPGALTGKLSDLAGMVVAPLLLATLLRVRTRKGLALAYLAVALVFSAIQLSAPIAAAWSSTMGLLGVPWAITMDPTDVLALAVMPLAWLGFAKTIEAPEASMRGLAFHSARMGAVGTGLVACVATSPAPPVDIFYGDIFASAYLHNESDSEVRVLLRSLRADVEVDCAAIGSDPGALLPDSAFGQGVLWAMPPRTTIAANEQAPGAGCRAVHVSGDSITPIILFWDGELEQRFVPGQILEGEPAPSWGVALRFEADGTFVGAADTGPQLAYAPKAAPLGGECAAPDEGARVDWVGIASGTHTLTGLEFGIDGCMRLAFDDELETSTSYLCMPLEAFPFATGDRLSVEAASDGHSLSMADADVAMPRELHVVRAGGLALTGFETASRPRLSCGLSVDPDCALVQAPAELLVVGAEASATLSMESPTASLAYDEGRTVDLELVFAAERALVDTACADGNLALGGDTEFIALVKPTI